MKTEKLFRVIRYEDAWAVTHHPGFTHPITRSVSMFIVATVHDADQLEGELNALVDWHIERTKVQSKAK